MEIKESIVKAINKASGLIESDWLFSDDFINDIYLDSLEHKEMIQSIEEDLNITIPDGDLEDLTTPDELLNYLDNKIN